MEEHNEFKKNYCVFNPLFATNGGFFMHLPLFMYFLQHISSPFKARSYVTKKRPFGRFGSFNNLACNQEQRGF